MSIKLKLFIALLFIIFNVLIINYVFEDEYCASKIFQFEKCEGK